MSVSEAAKARGQTGFLKPRRTYSVSVTCDGLQQFMHCGYVKKEAWSAARRWLKNTQDSGGMWKGWKVVFTISGKRVPVSLIAANHHAPKDL